MDIFAGKEQFIKHAGPIQMLLYNKLIKAKNKQNKAERTANAADAKTTKGA